MKTTAKTALVAALFATVGFAGGYVSKTEAAVDGGVKYFQCVDGVTQETVFEQDHVLVVANEYDQWVLELSDKLVSYVQPAGVSCVVQKSINAMENGTTEIP